MLATTGLVATMRVGMGELVPVFFSCLTSLRFSMIVVPNAACTSFTLHHLGEFECPHQYDVKVGGFGLTVSFFFNSVLDSSAV